MIFHDVEQNSDEWDLLRSGKLTGSKFGVIMAKEGSAFGDPARRLAMNIAVERLTGKPLTSSGFSNAHMDRGHEQEPIAKMLYEEETFSKVTNGGFFEHDGVGCSPDGLVDDDGVIEIKSVVASTHFANVKRQSFDPAYKWQIIGNLHYTGREYIDFISFCADYPKGRKLYICTVSKEQVKDEIERLLARQYEFETLIKKQMEVILNSNYEVKYATT